MRDFMCGKCGQRLSFENSVCLSCGGALGFHLPSRTLLVLDERDTVTVEGLRWQRCGNLRAAECNWLTNATDGSGGALCRSCRLTRTRPADLDSEAMTHFAEAEMSKRRVILELDELGLPIVGRDENPGRGLAFDLLSSADEEVMTGHEDGLITLDLAESDDVHREQLRVSMAEPYRTLVGHFRHELGHYYQQVLVDDGARAARFEALFGNAEQDYEAALDRNYRVGPPPEWPDHFVSSYAAMHPVEDWAETFAHYLHIRETIDTAAAFTIAPAGTRLDAPLPGNTGFDRLIDCWLPLSWALNQINRSMGHRDLYPFVLAPAVLDKMRFIHELIDLSKASNRRQPV
ncbi:putative zinc-binding metallopeptidase [Nocardia sp. JMUB6875]|uniref:zinc-binding metallopeptidase family protein n=1 Tax=Nocardia sp. JMUB6875 TaxID=3158170 RepID=UPI0032E5F5EB